MDLDSIVRDATGGFLGGFCIGLAGICDKYGERVKVAEESLPKNFREKIGFDDKFVRETKKVERNAKLFLPYVVGGAYGFIAGFVTSTPSFDIMAASVPAAYLGRFAGSALRKTLRSKYSKDLRVLRGIRDDPVNTLDYLPKETKEAIESSLGEIEKTILVSDPDAVEELLDSPVHRMYSSIMKGNKIYSHVLLKWGQEKFEEVCKHARIERGIMDFYERTEGVVSIAVFGQPHVEVLKLYEVDGESLRTYTATFNRLNVMRNDPAEPNIELESSPASIEIEKSEDWNQDYRSLADEVMKNQGSYTTMLIKAPPGLPDHVRTMMVTESFITSFAAYQKEKAYFSRYSA